MKFPPPPGHIGGNEFAGIGGNEGHKRQGTIGQAMLRPTAKARPSPKPQEAKQQYMW
jgi:hypothetical protein